MTLIRLALPAFLALTAVSRGLAQTAPRDTGLIISSVAQAVSRAPMEVEDLSLIVDLSDRRLFVMDGSRVVRQFPVSVGAADFPTPQGTFHISRLIWNPSWTPPPSAWARDHKPEAPGSPGNPMGRVKIFFQEPDYYIHGTLLPSSLGRPASHGCVRMRNADAAELGRLLMEEGGATRDAAWFDSMVEDAGTSRPVTLPSPVQLRVRA